MYAVSGIPEIGPGDPLAALIGDALAAAGPAPAEGDILVVTSKIVSKAEGRSVRADDREAAITAETVRVVATRAHPGGITRIVENRARSSAASPRAEASGSAGSSRTVPRGVLLASTPAAA